MKLIIVRHAESKANVKGIRQGQKIDTPLSKLGKEQAKKVAERLKNEKIDAIYSSDLKRAKETAEEIAKHHKLKVRLNKKLRERDHHNKEDWEDVVERTKSFLEDIKKHKGTVVVVSHGGVNRVMLAISTGDRKKGGKLFRTTTQEHTCINIVERKKGKYDIKLIDCGKHLK